MRAILLEVPDRWLRERRLLGHDKADEMWEGVLHMVPPAGGAHAELSGLLMQAMASHAVARGLVLLIEPGVFKSEKDYRVPDQAYAMPEAVSARGLESGAALVIEIRSPHDESYQKLPFYASVGVGEVAIIDALNRAVELYDCSSGEAVRVDPPFCSALALDLDELVRGLAQ